MTFADEVRAQQRAAAAGDQWRFGTVMAISPTVMVRLDGDTSADTPAVPLRQIAVGDRVWCQIHGTQVLVSGVVQSPARNATKELRRVGMASRVASTSNSTSPQNVATVTLPQVLTKTGYVFRIHAEVNIAPDTAGAFTELQIKAGINASTSGTVISGQYVDHRIAGRIVGVSVTAEWTYDLTENVSNANIVGVIVPSNGALISANSTRLSSVIVDWVVP